MAKVALIGNTGWQNKRKVQETLQMLKRKFPDDLIIIGAGGNEGAGAAGVTELVGDEKLESKIVLLNFTVNVYGVPFDNPVTTIGELDPVCEIELGDETTV